jgi:hypothetical protein
VAAKVVRALRRESPSQVERQARKMERQAIYFIEIGTSKEIGNTQDSREMFLFCW